MCSRKKKTAIECVTHTVLINIKKWNFECFLCDDS